MNRNCQQDVYVYKIGEKYGVLDYFGQQMIEPKFEKLGDFKNDMAYFIEKGNFSIGSITMTPLISWIRLLVFQPLFILWALWVSRK